MNEQDYLPPVAQEIVEVIGFDGFMRLVKHYGGITIRVPGQGDLKKVLTPEQYKDFVHTYRNLKVCIPRMQASLTRIEVAETLRLAEQGYTRTQIARHQNITERNVYLRLAKVRQEQDDKQQELF